MRGLLGGFQEMNRARQAMSLKGLSARLLIALLIALSFPYSANAFVMRNTPPSHRVAPVVTGIAQVGQFVQVLNGTWSGGAPFQFTYQWYACSSIQSSVSVSIPRSCTKINGARQTSFWPQKAQRGKYLAALITARNSAGTGQVLTKTTKTKIT